VKTTAGHETQHRQSWRSGFERPTIALVAAITAVSFGVVFAPGGASASSSGPTLTKSGEASEGPYPWKYPATGNITPGTGTTVSGQKCTPGAPQFNSPYADPCIPKFTGNNGGATSRG
jgi:hypothetical protein